MTDTKAELREKIEAVVHEKGDWAIAETVDGIMEIVSPLLPPAPAVGEAVTALKGAVQCAEGLMTDFEGCTDNPSDPSRLHEWGGILHERFDWMEDARKALAALGEGGA